jgi:hypothetical protein
MYKYGSVIVSAVRISFRGSIQCRAKLHSILAALYILQDIEKENGGALGLVRMKCNNMEAHNLALLRRPLGLRQATHPDHDILLESYRIKTELRVTIESYWEPTDTEKLTKVEPAIRYITPQEACTEYDKNPETQLIKAGFPPSHVITPLLQGKVCQEDLRKNILKVLHYPKLQEKIMKDNQWDHTTFHLIDWNAYNKAIQSIPRSHRISITKLSHQLWHTNHQDYRYYGNSPECPLCQKNHETIPHVYTCPSTAAQEIRSAAITTIQTELTSSKALDAVVVAILANIPGNTTNEVTTQSPELRAAITEQGVIGWEAMLRGHISTKWRAAYIATLKNKDKLDKLGDKWAKKVILALWSYSKNIWKGRNGVVHKKTEIGTGANEAKALSRQIKQMYEQFEDDPYIVPSTRRHLFDRSIDYMEAQHVTVMR